MHLANTVDLFHLQWFINSLLYPKAHNIPNPQKQLKRTDSNHVGVKIKNVKQYKENKDLATWTFP